MDAISPSEFPAEVLRLFRKRHVEGVYLTQDEALELRRLLGLKPWHDSVLDPALDRDPPEWMTEPHHRRNWRYVAGLRRRLLEAARQ